MNPYIPLDELTPEDRHAEILRMQREHDRRMANARKGWRAYTADEIVNNKERGDPSDFDSWPWKYLMAIAKTYNSECMSHFKLGYGDGKIYYRDEVFDALVRHGIFDSGALVDHRKMFYQRGYPSCPKGPCEFAWKREPARQLGWKKWHSQWAWLTLLTKFLRKLQKPEKVKTPAELRDERKFTTVPLVAWKEFYQKLDDYLEAEEKVPDFYIPPAQMQSPMHDMIAGGKKRRRSPGGSFLHIRFQEVGDYGHGVNAAGF